MKGFAGFGALVRVSLVVSLVAGGDGLAQSVGRQAVEIDALGRTTANLLTGPYTETGISYGILSGVNHEQIFGGALAGYSFALTPHLAVEVRGGFLFGHQPTVTQSGGEQILAHAGLRGTYPIGHSRFSFTARVAPGIASFSNAYRSGQLTETLYPNGTVLIQVTPLYARLTHFSLEEGVGISTRLTGNTALHFDLGHETMLEGDRRSGALGFPASVEDHLLLSAGVSRTFGKAMEASAWDAGVGAGSPHNEVVVSLAVQPQVHLSERSFGTDAGIAVTGSHFFRPWIAVDSSVIYLGGGDSPDYQDGGHETELLAGVKLGIQRARYGIFAKVRPGYGVFSKTYQNVTASGPVYDASGDLIVDAGAVLELYPAKHLVVRADLGEIFTRYAPATVHFTGNTGQQPVIVEAAGQFLVGVGWRF